MALCKKCGKVSEETAKVLSLCVECIRKADKKSLVELSAGCLSAEAVHARSRQGFNLPASPPSNPDGIQCNLCQNKCRIPAAGRGYCGVRRNEGGLMKGGTPAEAVVSWYNDPLPTNCVADWVCAGGSGAGYPQWAYRPGPEQGYVNLAVFYQACTFDCLFCQNWHYREHSTTNQTHTAAELAEAVTAQTSCICFFGGDPTCQLPHALAASRLARPVRNSGTPGEQGKGTPILTYGVNYHTYKRVVSNGARKQNRQRILRICWETNGSMSPELLEEMMGLSVESGGCIKFDLKAMDANIHYALCGVDNRRTFENFAAAARHISERPEPPPLVASTLLVPGYIDAQEVKAIASFIAKLDSNIPYALLGFHGDFLMTDLPSTSWKQAESCLEAATEAGLKRVRIGNVHILR